SLNHCFPRSGVAEPIVSGSGPRFILSEFSIFCRSLDVQHIRSPIYHPQSFGQADRFAGMFERSLMKLQEEGYVSEILDTFPQAYRLTLNQARPNDQSPANAFLGRKMRTHLNAMLPPTVSNEPNH
ncbi:uncharacterized protein DEA37_0010019, partial [Paragonimus westermani]